jgi:hypothetical protein
MKRKDLTEDQLQQVSSKLRQYGIESPDLLEELTDHYARGIEENMDSGKRFTEAFEEFAAANSWLKLRKLQHAHWNYAQTSLKRFILNSLRQLWFTPRVFWALLVFVGIYVGMRLEASETIIVVLHAILVIHTLALTVFSALRFRKIRILDIGYAAQAGVTIFYFLLFPLWFGPNEAYPYVDAVGVWGLTGYFAFMTQLAYLHFRVFQRADARYQRAVLVGS